MTGLLCIYFVELSYKGCLGRQCITITSLGHICDTPGDEDF